MAETLDEQLDGLVLENWPLVYQLHSRAEQVRKKLLKASAALLSTHKMLAENGLGQDQIMATTKNWYLCLPYGDQVYVSYVQVEIDTNTSSPGARVFTGFNPRIGLPYADVKQALSADLRKSFDDAFDDSTGNAVVLDVHRRGSLGDLPGRIVDEVERQLAIALALRDFIAKSIEASTTEDSC